MLNRVDTEEAQRRAELVMEVQSQVMDQFNDSRMGDTVEVLCDGWDGQSMSYVWAAAMPRAPASTAVFISHPIKPRGGGGFCPCAHHRRHGRRAYR